jgi:RNA polymerase sigma factor (sigma-70 family)
MSDDDPRRDARLHALFTEYADQVLRYALRQVDHATASDVVGDTFLVACRRIDHVPESALPWLLVVARNSIRNRLRGSTRGQRTAAEFAAVERAAATAAGADELVVERTILMRALAQLSADQREVLLLVAWDGLTAAEGARVVGCTRAAFEVRLHRARSRLRNALDADEPQPVTTAKLKEIRS